VTRIVTIRPLHPAFIGFVFLGLFAPKAKAEYRAYQLLVERPSAQLRDGRFRWVSITHLSPDHYRSYHGGMHSLKTRLLRTWMCPGTTANFKETCQSPYPLAEVPEPLLTDQSIPFEKIPDLLEAALAEKGWKTKDKQSELTAKPGGLQ